MFVPEGPVLATNPISSFGTAVRLGRRPVIRERPLEAGIRPRAFCIWLYPYPAFL